MEQIELIESGINATDTLIKYLSKDALGSEFLSKYMTSKESQQKVTDEQKQALNKIISTSGEIESDTKLISERVQENVNNLNKIYEEIAELKTSVTKISNDHKKYVALFESLIEQTGKITALISEIQNISEQTNLLSFNASIEAAHAGAAGAGFRIIANEVKKLSDNTKTTSEQIGQNVEKLKNSIHELESETRINTDSLNRLSSETETTLERFNAVRSTNNQNNLNVEKITGNLSLNMQNINSIVHTVQNEENRNNETLNAFAECASKNQMLFNDLYSFIYEIRAVLEDLKK